MSDQVKNIRFNFVIDTQPLQAANVAGTNLSATTTQLKTNLGQVGAAAQQAGTQASSAFNSAAVPLKNYNNVVNDIGINLRKIPSSAQAAGSALSGAATSNVFQWRLLEQEIGTRVPMALNRVLGQSQALSGIMSKVFPIVAAAGFATVIGEIALKFIDWATNQKAVIAGIEQVGQSLERAQARTTRNLTASRAASDRYIGLTQGPGAEEAAKIARQQQEVTAAAYRYDQMRRGTAATIQGTSATRGSVNPIISSLGMAFGVTPPGQGAGFNADEVVFTRNQRIALAQQYQNEAKADLDKKAQVLANMQREEAQRATGQAFAGQRESSAIGTSFRVWKGGKRAAL